MKQYSSNIVLRLPLMLPALFFALISFALFYICVAETSIAIPSFVQKACIFIMASFLALVAFSLIRIGFRDYWVAIEPGKEGLRFRGLFRTVSLKWEDIRQVHQSISTLSITGGDGMMVNVSSDLGGFEEFKDLVISKNNKAPLAPPPISPEDIISQERI